MRAGEKLLRSYIKMLMEGELARVPNQLVSDTDEDDDDDHQDEASGVGAIAGCISPVAFKKSKK